MREVSLLESKTFDGPPALPTVTLWQISKKNKKSENTGRFTIFRILVFLKSVVIRVSTQFTTQISRLGRGWPEGRKS